MLTWTINMFMVNHINYDLSIARSVLNFKLTEGLANNTISSTTMLLQISQNHMQTFDWSDLIFMENAI